MNHQIALSKAGEIAERVLAPAARQNDRDGSFSTEAVGALGQAGFFGLTLPTEFGGLGLVPRTFAAVTATLAEADASVAMVYLMHICAVAAIAAARPSAAVAQILKEIASGGHLSTLAFSEPGSRSHFWAPVSRARRNGAGRAYYGEKVVCDQRWTRAELRGLVACARRCRSYRFDALPCSGRRTRTFGGGFLGRLGATGQRLRSNDAR